MGRFLYWAGIGMSAIGGAVTAFLAMDGSGAYMLGVMMIVMATAVHFSGRLLKATTIQPPKTTPSKKPEDMTPAEFAVYARQNIFDGANVGSI